MTTSIGRVRSVRTSFGSRSALGPTIALSILAVLLAAVVSFANPDFAGLLPALLVFIVTLGLTWRRLSPIALSPSFYFAAYLAVVAILGLLLTNALVGAGGTGGIDVAIPAEMAVATASAMLLAGALTLAAAAFVRGGVGGGGAQNIFDLGSLSKYAGWFLVFGTLELFAVISFLGFSDLMSRVNRLVGRGSSFEAVIAMAAIAAFLVVSIAFFTRRGPVKLYALMLMLGFVGYFVSLGTRRLALLPILLILAYAMANKGRIPLVPAILAGITALLSLALPLHFRGQELHGIIPHIGSLAAFDLSLDVIATSFNNFLAGFKITAMTGFAQPPIPIEVLWISLNPITGDLAGWYDVSRSLRLNQFTPYSAIGELINYGPVVFTAVFAALGAVLGLIQRINDRLLGDTLGRFIVILALGLIFIFVIQSAQYNLRSDVRYVYLALMAQGAGLLLITIRNSVGKRSGRITA
ncbi:hypothetical protein [Marisediminicola sp. LYQ134]|uniref:hypothetical protein n=1 Tax=Marisediminicola sp. LYQ134 TaxID=3391061 RepID=UPI00398356CF